MPRTSGRSSTDHIALTLDDGPDDRTTPAILDTLDRFDVRATFFVIGEHARRQQRLLQRMHDSGHELAVHGWTHTSVLRLRLSQLTSELARTADVISQATGERVRWYRPPYGVTTLGSRDAARRVGLEPVLWTAWGRDWSRHVQPPGIVRRVERTLRPGGTVLLHDTDRYAAPGSWRNTNEALEVLLGRWREAGNPVGPLREHGLG